MASLTVLDTNVVIYFLEGRLAAALPDGGLQVSIISEIELRSHAPLTEDGEAIIRRFLSAVDVVGLTPAITEAAIVLRRQHRLTIPDAVIVATAQVLGAELLSNDARLSGLPDVRVRAVDLNA